MPTCRKSPFATFSANLAAFGLTSRRDDRWLRAAHTRVAPPCPAQRR